MVGGKGGGLSPPKLTAFNSSLPMGAKWFGGVGDGEGAGCIPGSLPV